MQLLRKIRVALTPRTAFLKTTLADGLVIYGRNRAGYGGRGIYIYRESIEPEFNHLNELLGSAGVFVDVGASTGIYALKAARHLGAAGTVLALEPFPEVFATLQRNVQANRLATIRIRCLCAGEQTSVRTLWLNHERPSLFSLVERIGTAHGLSVLTVALDDLLRWEGIDHIDYLKIDAEGAEEEILAGARQTIERSRPIIQTEISIRHVVVALPGYSVFRADGSPNLVYIPGEHAKIQLPERLRWKRLTS